MFKITYGTGLIVGMIQIRLKNISYSSCEILPSTIAF